MNKDIIDYLEEFRLLRLEENQIYKAMAYEYAINYIKNLDHEIICANELKNVKGFGKSILGKIDKILKKDNNLNYNDDDNICEYYNNEINEIKEINENKENKEDDEYTKTINLFKSVYSLGNIKAIELYNLGYRNLEDIPFNLLSKSQQIGIKYYNDINKKIPRKEIDEIYEILNKLVKDIIICGSYRRGLNYSGDIDIIVIGEDNYNLLLTSDIFKETIIKGKKKYRGLLKIHSYFRRVDIEVVTNAEYPFAILYFTGSKNFNILCRKRAKELNYKLNEKELINIKNNKKIYCKTEKDIFNKLNIEYLEPFDRNY